MKVARPSQPHRWQEKGVICAMKTIVNSENLCSGILFWLNTLTRWPADFHNQLYSYLHQRKAQELSEEWWAAIVDVLWNWRAIRPKSKGFIYERGKGCLHDLEQEYQLILQANGMHELDLSEISWQQASGLFTLSTSIKGVKSPVFASKLCHFLLPNCFPVIDHAVIGVRHSYPDYWCFCQSLWAACTEKHELIQQLRAAIGEPVVSHYPYATKIVELCLIGSRITRGDAV